MDELNPVLESLLPFPPPQYPEDLSLWRENAIVYLRSLSAVEFSSLFSGVVDNIQQLYMTELTLLMAVALERIIPAVAPSSFPPVPFSEVE
jgi:hypothetical protein